MVDPGVWNTLKSLLSINWAAVTENCYVKLSLDHKSDAVDRREAVKLGLLRSQAEALHRVRKMRQSCLSRCKSEREPWHSRIARLTPRERQVAVAMVGGGTYRQIAEDLGVSAKTVHKYAARIIEVFDAENRYTACLMLRRHGVLGPLPKK